MPTPNFSPKIYTAPNGQTLPYEWLMPLDWVESQKYPLVIFLHGAGERGTDNVAQLAHVATKFADPAFQTRYPCFAFAPQCPTEQKWADFIWDAPSGVRPPEPSKALTLALDAVTALTAEFNIDAKRIYVTGLSMGGYGVWDCVTRYPERFAAGVACCGGGDESTVTAAVAPVPFWAFHSADDNVVPVARSRNMVEAMKKMGGAPRYTEYEDAGHGSWDAAFNDPELYPWLFKQTLPDPRP